MKEIPSDNTVRLPIWLIKLCQWLWKRQPFIWTTLILGVALNLFATWLFTPWSTDYKKLPLWIVIQNPIISLFFGILFILLTFIIYLTSHMNNKTINGEHEELKNPILESKDEKVGENNSTFYNEAKRRYLFRLLRDYETLTLQGIPAGLIDKGVSLEDVFIPLELRPNRPLTEYPLTEHELYRLHEHLEKGDMPEEMERILIEAEKSWYNHKNKSNRITIAGLWKRLNSKRPAIVIQGYPGMGKSTLMARLTLHMVRRILNQDDSTMPEQLDPPLIPIFLSLGRYATEISQAKKSDFILSLNAYLELSIKQMNIPDLINFIQNSLAAGHCLILLDGLDEVSDLQIRKEIQEATKIFIAENSDNSPEKTHFNHFIITSRVAGYDQNAFPSFEHFTVAELTPTQIKDFLPRWCKANVHRDSDKSSEYSIEKEETIAKEAEQIANRLDYSITHNQGVRELAEIPLMLTLLAIMQQNSIELPRERVELYTVVTRTLLENRNIAKNLPIIPEALAIQRLGPIAFQMQETGNSFVRLSNVLNILKRTIENEQGGSPEQITQEAYYFLNRVRERAGIFNQRTGDYYSFFHRSFQEYFTARYLLNESKNHPGSWLSDLVGKARRSDDLWREPFLFAVAYKSRDDEAVAQQIIQKLLDNSPMDDFNAHIHDILLAGECVVEAKSSTIGSKIEKQIASQLLQGYEEAQRNQLFNVCEQIENVMTHWLMSIPNESYRPALLTVLSDAVNNRYTLEQQRATLTLLANICGKITFCSSIVYDTLVDFLSRLAGLSGLSDLMNFAGISKAQDLLAADLASISLVLMRSRGLGGLYLANIRKHLKNHPEHLQLAARYSLEMHTLLTPVIIPSLEENFEYYLSVIPKWFDLRDQTLETHFTDKDLNACLGIHQNLLDLGEDAHYPGSIHFLQFLKEAERSSGSLDQPMKYLVQKYLPAFLSKCDYILYQDTFIYMMVIFTEEEMFKYISGLLIKHFFDKDIISRYARRFISVLCDLAFVDFDGRYQLMISSSSTPPDPRSIRFLSCLRVIESIEQHSDIYYYRNAYLSEADKKNFEVFSVDKLSMTTVRYIHSKIIHHSFHDNVININKYLKMLIAHKVIDRTLELLSSSSLDYSDDIEERKELIRILLGQIIIMQTYKSVSDTIRQSAEKVLQFINENLHMTTNKEMIEIMFDILRYLPAHSAEEMQQIISLVENTPDSKLQLIYAESLKHSNPKTTNGWAMLEVAATSKILAISSAAKERLKYKEERLKYKSQRHPNYDKTTSP